MTLKARLDQLQSQAGTQPLSRQGAQTSSGTSSLHQRLAGFRAERVHGTQPKLNPRQNDEQLATQLGGRVVSEGLVRIEKTLPFEQRLGNTSLQVLDRIQSLPGESEPTTGIYIDTETTGLAGGSGTLAFLIGIATIRQSEIRLVQFLMTRYDAEGAMLSAFEQSLPAGHDFVSYNGKSYDIPLLLTRFRMQGMARECLERSHLDLLHPVRRLFSKQWNDCRLTTVEQQLLDFHRRGDLPGSEAPEAWFNYLRYGYAQNLAKVVRHNQQDIVSLAVCHALLGRVVRKPDFYRADIHNLARWISEQCETEAIGVLESHAEKLCSDGRRLLALLYRRQNRWDDALPLWEALAQQRCIESIEKLAKYHEHVSKDLQMALEYSCRLPGTEADLHRIRRIRQKLAAASMNRTIGISLR
ncbi:MAG: ribonuclease H-like domain-containing protein [Sedimenticola sp.]